MEIIGYKDKHEYTNKNRVTSVVYLMDCMELLKQVPDKYFELAVVDPPYGIGYARGKNGWGICDNRPTLDDVKWDKCIPDKEYFDLLLKTSQNSIIWGGHYFTDKLPVSKCWIVWNKISDTDNKSVFADADLAYTTFNKVVKMYIKRSMGFISDTKDGNRIHPTQKPSELYEWIFKNYAKPNDKILDTHLGSGSSRIAADRANLPFVGCELDPDYFYASVKRFREYSAQQTMF